MHIFYLFVCLIIFFSALKGKVEREHYFDAHIISSVHVDHSLRLVQTFTMAKTNSGDLCPKRYSTTLVHHVTTHSSGTNLYECDQCNQTFDQARSLKNHKLTHSGEKTQRCVHCTLCNAANQLSQLRIEPIYGSVSAGREKSLFRVTFLAALAALYLPC